MNRRDLLAWCLTGCCTAALGSSRHGLAQQQPAGGIRPAAAGDDATGGRVPRPSDLAAEAPVDPALDQLLTEWEQKTSYIKRLRGEFQRYEYDSVFVVEKRAVGRFWFESPDKGRMDFFPPDLSKLSHAEGQKPTNPDKKSPAGDPYVIEAATPERWICNGAEILQIDERTKGYNRVEIPPQMRGENIGEGPLPFLFGMKADKAKARYTMRIGSMHNPTGANGGKARVHVVAEPRLASDRREWSRAEVLLDPKYFLPHAIRLIDPSGNRETVYMFPFNTYKWNEKIWLDDPFSESLRGYQLMHNQTTSDPGTNVDPKIAPGSKNAARP